MNNLLTRQKTFKSINDNLGDGGAFFDRFLLDGVPQFVADSNVAQRCVSHLSDILFTIKARSANLIVKINSSIISAKKCFVSFSHKPILLIADVALWLIKQTIQTTPNRKHFIVTFKPTIFDRKISNLLRRLCFGINFNKFVRKCNRKLGSFLNSHCLSFQSAPELVSVGTVNQFVGTESNPKGGQRV